MNPVRPLPRRSAAALIVLAIGAACATSGGRSPETEAALETYYADWEAEIVDAFAELGDDDVARLRDVWPTAEFEGATEDVLDVLYAEASLRPFVRRLRRFRERYPSNAVRYQMRIESVDRRTWHVLLDTVNAELRERPR